MKIFKQFLEELIEIRVSGIIEQTLIYHAMQGGSFAQIWYRRNEFLKMVGGIKNKISGKKCKLLIALKLLEGRTRSVKKQKQQFSRKARFGKIYFWKMLCRPTNVNQISWKSPGIFLELLLTVKRSQIMSKACFMISRKKQVIRETGFEKIYFWKMVCRKINSISENVLKLLIAIKLSEVKKQDLQLEKNCSLTFTLRGEMCPNFYNG